MNAYKQKEADMFRLTAVCGMCGNKKYWLKRVIVKTPAGNIISPSFFCGKCRKVISNVLK